MTKLSFAMDLSPNLVAADHHVQPSHALNLIWNQNHSWFSLILVVVFQFYVLRHSFLKFAFYWNSNLRSAQFAT